MLTGSDLALDGFDVIDINVEKLAASKFNEIKYVLGVSDVYE